MLKPQYAILRFSKYKGPEISRIEAHNERKKENYSSNPDIGLSRSHLNYHLIPPHDTTVPKQNVRLPRPSAAPGLTVSAWWKP